MMLWRSLGLEFTMDDLDTHTDVLGQLGIGSFVSLTRSGRVRMNKDLGEWNRLVEAMTAVLSATRAELQA